MAIISLIRKTGNIEFDIIINDVVKSLVKSKDTWLYTMDNWFDHLHTNLKVLYSETPDRINGFFSILNSMQTAKLYSQMYSQISKECGGMDEANYIYHKAILSEFRYILNSIRLAIVTNDLEFFQHIKIPQRVMAFYKPTKTLIITHSDLTEKAIIEKLDSNPDLVQQLGNRKVFYDLVMDTTLVIDI